MNNYADYIQNYVVSSMDKISEGNFDFEFLIKDDKDEIGPALKKTAESIKGLVNEVNTLTSAAIEGKLQERGNKEKFKGLYRDIIFQESITRWMRQLSRYMKRLAYLKK